RIIGLGVEKVAISAAAIASRKLISDSAAHVGSQSIVVVIDVKKTGLLRRYEVVTHNATVRTGLDPAIFACEAEALGAGEIVVNNVDRDGTMQGYDNELVDRIREAVTLPVSVLGGAGSLEDISALYARHGIIGAAAGSLFVFKGKYRAVLINYPNRSEKAAVMQKAGTI
ncbi:MAG: HisA/HisF-related TIM barrel protein, partial [Actinomycetota bacterium]|nr:HisA/HisF-related TIM barrel protein [Actinomycetota bacterium]